jgi:hypothetical protein
LPAGDGKYSRAKSINNNKLQETFGAGNFLSLAAFPLLPELFYNCAK